MSNIVNTGTIGKCANFMVGPAQLYTGVEEFYSQILQNGIGSISHRSQQFTEISKEGLEYARQFFAIPDDYTIYYTYSATESMELVVRGLVKEKSVHIVNGNFGNVWYKTAVHNGRKTKKFENTIPFSYGSENTRVDLSVVVQEFEGGNLGDMICITGSETASGIGYSPKEISEFSRSITNVSENTLLAVDITSSMGAIDYDFSSADVWLFSVQKALGLPAGLGFLICSPRAQRRAQEIEEERVLVQKDFGNHHAISVLEKKMHEKYQTPTTPNVLAIAGFGYVCKKLLEDFGSIQQLSQYTDEKADIYYSFFESEQNTSDFVPAIEDTQARTKTVIVLRLKNAETLSEQEREQKMNAQIKRLRDAGYSVASGYGKLKTTQLRLANFPVHTKHDIEKLLYCFS